MSQEKSKCPIGEKFGRWTVLEEAQREKGRRRWRCECNCGTVRDVDKKSLVRGLSKGCKKCSYPKRILKRAPVKKKNKTILPIKPHYEIVNKYGKMMPIKRSKCPIGKSFGKWTIIGEAESNGKGRIWICQCECGTIRNVSRSNLMSGASSQCLQCSYKSRPHIEVKCPIGKRFGKWTVMSEALRQKDAFWNCKCDCGTVKAVRVLYLFKGNTKQCCHCAPETHFTTHGQWSHPLYHTWWNMIQRCENTETPHFKGYGSRGITVCDEWHDINNFINDMGDRPTTEHSLDRINNDNGYFKENCRWATKSEQNLNRRTTRLITYRGETKALVEWSRRFGVGRTTLSCYLKNHTMQEAFERYKK